MTQVETIAIKWEKRLTPLFKNSCYSNGENKIIFKLSPPELRELFEVGEEKMSQKYFTEMLLMPVIRRLKQRYKQFISLPITVDSQFLGFEFKVTRYGGQMPPKSPTKKWISDRFKDVKDIQTCSNIQRLKYWHNDNAAFLTGLLCEYDEGLRTGTAREQAAIESRLSILGTG